MLSKDISLKIISVFVAIVLWLFVYNNNNPLGVNKVNITLKVLNEESLREKGIVLKSYEQNIEVRVRGRAEDIKNVSSTDFQAYLDFSKVKSADDQYVSIEEPIYKGSGEIYDFTRSVKVDVERYETKAFKVDVSTVGKLKQGYKVINLSYAPETIQIEGLESVINSVDQIKAEIDVTNLDRDILNRKYDCKVYDKTGKIMTQLSRDSTVEVSVEVGKEVPVTIVTKGKPAIDFVEIARSIAPQTVVVAGQTGILSKLTELRTEPVDISKIKSNFTTTGIIKVPDGIHLVDVSSEVEVTINVEKLIYEDLSIPKDSIQIVNTELPELLVYEIKTEAAIVSVKGRKVDLDSLVVEGLKPTLDVVGLKEGLHRVPLKILLPSGVTQIQNVFVEVKISPTPVVVVQP